MAALALACAFASATTVGTSERGVRFATGGVSDDELTALRAVRNDYSLWITTAARGSGAYLADVVVVVRDAKREVVFEQTMDGPWLFVALPPGRYAIEATLSGETHRTNAVIGASGHRQVVLYFDTGDQVSPDYEGRKR
jgi:hypothetical protein